MMRSIYKKHATHIVLFVLLLAMVGIVWYGVIPLKQSVYEKMQGIQEFYARGENRDKQVARLPELKAQYDAVVENEKLFDILIMEDKIVDFVKTLEGLASETNVEMSITSKDNGQIVELKKPAPKPSQSASNGDSSGSADTSGASTATKQKTVDILDDASFSRYLHLSVQARGRYEDIVVFLRKMETLPVALDVIGVDMKVGDVQNAVPPVSSGTGMNPFLVSSGTVSTETPPPIVQGDVFEAVFDVLVYVDKQN